MRPGKKRLHERLSVSLDLESANLIEKLQSTLETSKSEVVRRALEHLNVVVTEKGDIDPENLKTIVRLHSRPDIVSFDLSILEAFLDEVGEGSEELKENLREIGREVYREYCDMGVSNPLKCLRSIEKTNLFQMIVDSENCVTLISTAREMDKFLKEFFEGFLKELPHQTKITSQYGKIRIRIEGEMESP